MCKWAQNPDEVEFALSVLERLAKRYGNRKGLFGIQPLNEPITENMWETMDIQNRYAPADQEMAKGSAPITMKFLRQFYLDAYDRISAYMPKDKYVVIHDGFELMEWKDFMQEEIFQCDPGYPSVSHGCGGQREGLEVKEICPQTLKQL